DERGQPREQALLAGVEQIVAPVDRRAQRLLALGRVADAAGQQREAAPEAAEDLGRPEHLHARRRELDRKRQPVEPDADLADRGFVLVRGIEVATDAGRPLEEEL